MHTKNGLYPSQAESRKKKSQKAKQIATCGEDKAANFLTQQGYRILKRNFFVHRTGEIDIIALSRSDTIVFVEVKTRSVDEPVFGIPEVGFEAVGYLKQKRILAASQAYLAQTASDFRRWRYDVIVVGISADPDIPAEITHVIDAFR